LFDENNPLEYQRRQRGELPMNSSSTGRVATLALLLLLFVASTASELARAADKPPVRAITAFIEVDPARLEPQVRDTAKRLRDARAVFQRAGYEVQTIRVTTQPYPQYVRGMSKQQAIDFLSKLADLGRNESLAVNIGPGAMDGKVDTAMLDLLEAMHSDLKPLDASMIVANENGVHWNIVRAAAHHVYRVAQKSPRSQGTFSFAATAMLLPGAPFYPGSYHQDGGGRFSVGLQSPSLVARAFAQAKGDADLATRLLHSAFAAEAQQVHELAKQVEQITGWKYWGFDSTPAPLKDDSIGAAMEAFQGKRLGSAGTMTAAYIITKAQANLPPPSVGYNGLMIPVLEDALIARRWSEGVLSIDSLLGYSAVCGTGLDTVPLPGDVTEETLARIIGDMAVLAYKWKKPLTARLQPVRGRKAGEVSEFDDPFLVNAKLQPVP
jgi:uncharacterized protein (UPF0210 family)